MVEALSHVVLASTARTMKIMQISQFDGGDGFCSLRELFAKSLID
jgi:hypothetical protein